jgi:hypothetical protein
MSAAMRKHLAEIQAIAVDMTAALDRGELPTIFDANIIEYRAQALAVSVRNAFITGLVEVPSGSAEDLAAQRYIETRRGADGVAALLDDTEPMHSAERDNRQPENAA